MTYTDAQHNAMTLLREAGERGAIVEHVTAGALVPGTYLTSVGDTPTGTAYLPPEEYAWLLHGGGIDERDVRFSDRSHRTGQFTVARLRRGTTRGT